MCPQQFRKLVVVSAPGLHPPQGEILDMFLVVARRYIEKSFHAPADTPEYQELYGGEIGEALADTWEYAREETCRLTWRPYMHYPGLAPLLHRAQTPANPGRSRARTIRLSRSALVRRIRQPFLERNWWCSITAATTLKSSIQTPLSSMSRHFCAMRSILQPAEGEPRC